MHRLFILTLCCGLLLAGPAYAARQLRVVTTIPDLAYFAQQVGGDHVSAESISKPTENVHFVQVKPSTLAKLNKADVFVQIGLELESWATPLLARTSSRDIRPGGSGYILASAGCQLLEIPQGRVDRSMGDIHPAGNPHCWLSPGNAKRMALNICNGLSRVDPPNTADYIANYDRLAKSIDKAATDARALLAGIEHPTVVAHHSTFPYLFQTLGITTYGLVEPRPGIAPGPQHLANLKSGMQSSGVRVVVSEPILNERDAKAVADGAGATLVILSQNVGSFPNTDSWESLLLENTRRLAAALRGGQP